MNNFVIITIICCLVFFAACEKNNPTISNDNEVVVGSGNITSETPTLAEFHTVVLEGSGNINIREGLEQGVIVDADDNVHQYLTLSVSNGILTIKTDQDISFRNASITYGLTMTDLEKVSIIGAGNIAIPYGFERDMVTIEVIGAGNVNAYLHVDTLTTNLIGAGNFNLTGEAYKHKIILAGAGGISSFGLETNLSDITLAGAGNIQVDVSQTLIALISGIGNIYYEGSPTIDATITGVGSLIQDN
ncbi:MAG: DUF2807 domain-containing protein [candidate division Zixibacteria bacterium]|nr:DUF2807 domain-containing protein [candidate division Zixibacteria bacterium]